MFSHRVVGLIPVLLLCVAILLPDESMGSCDVMALQKCNQGDPVPKDITSESLQTYCNITEETLTCVRSSGCHDHPNIRLIYQGMNDLFNAICGTLRNEYLSHANCYESSEVKEGETLCTQQEGNNIDTRFTDCEKKSRTMSCVVRSVDSCCGAEAAQLYATLTKTLFGPAAASSGCQLQTHLEVAVPLVCVSTVPEETTRRLEYTTSQLTTESTVCNSSAVNDVCLKDFHTSVPTEKYLIDNKERKVLCKAFRPFVSCLESTGCHGIPSVAPLYNGFKKGIQFVCNDTTLQNEFAASCWNSYGFQNAQVFCAAYAKNQSVDSQRSDCEQKNDLVACLVKSVNKCCGPEAAEYAGQSILAMMVPLMKTKKCQLEVRTGATEIDQCGAYVHPPDSPSPGSNPGLIAAIVIIVLVVVIGVVVGVVLLLKRHRMAEWLRV